MDKEQSVLAAQRAYFSTGATRSRAFRLEQLSKLLWSIKRLEPEILSALKSDLGKPEYEAYVSEVAFMYDEIRHTRRHLGRWMRPKKVRTSWLLGPSKGQVLTEPRGSVFIIAPWNYPFQLLLAPLVGAIAAGNCAILKPSELAPATSAIVAKLIRETFEENYIAAFEGGLEVSQKLLALKHDYIFFTGGTQVGRVIMEAAARHLTPITLELGGKSPCIVDESSDLKVTTKRVAWGKFFNAGQTCVAPDYVLVHKKIQQKFLEEMKLRVEEFFGPTPEESPDYARIINTKHFDRLSKYIDGKKPFLGGKTNREKRYFAPTILTDAKVADPVMQEEIFGPILPVLPYERLDEAVKFVNSRPKPLAFYFFSKESSNKEKVLSEISFGGGCINDTLVHLMSPDLPFGGVGESGIGAYHGKHSYDLFSHHKSVVKKPFFADVALRYPPYGNRLNWIKKLLG
jgi:aldehyde dehydrogenase (NAD+)